MSKFATMHDEDDRFSGISSSSSTGPGTLGEKFTICRQISSPITIQYKGDKSVLWALLDERKTDKNLRDMDFISNEVYTLDANGKHDAVVKMHHDAHNYNQCRMIYTQKHVGKDAKARYKEIETQFKLHQEMLALKPVKVESKSPSGKDIKVSPRLQAQTPSPVAPTALVSDRASNSGTGYYNDTSRSKFTLKNVKTGKGSIFAGNKQGDRSIMAGIHQPSTDETLLEEMEKRKRETTELKLGPAKNDPTDIDNDIADAPIDDEIYDADSDLENEALTACGGRDTTLPIIFLREGAKVAESAVKIRYPWFDEDGYLISDSLRQGTAFIIGYFLEANKPYYLLMTNHHCLSKTSQATHRTAEVIYDYDDTTKNSSRSKMAPDVFWITDSDLDFTIVACETETEPTSVKHKRGSIGSPSPRPSPPPSPRPIISLRDKTLRLLKDDRRKFGDKNTRVFIIQHPRGKEKRVSVQGVRVKDTTRPKHYILYNNDTQKGSSGSPVFNFEWKLVALHHRGLLKRDANKTVLNIQGGIWQPGQEKAYIANQGVLIEDIFAKLLNVKAEELLQADRTSQYQILKTVILLHEEATDLDEAKIKYADQLRLLEHKVRESKRSEDDDVEMSQEDLGDFDTPEVSMSLPESLGVQGTDPPLAKDD